MFEAKFKFIGNFVAALGCWEPLRLAAGAEQDKENPVSCAVSYLVGMQ